MGPIYLPNEKIDRIKWDKCIKTASNGLIYASSVYLDKMSGHWDAIVLNDYETVMPLTWKRKFGIHYLYQPPFTPCLGVFGNKLNAATIELFLHSIPSKFRYWDISINSGNFFSLTTFNMHQRVNYILDLGRPYDELAALYRENITRNIKKSNLAGLAVIKDIEPAGIIALAREQALQFSRLTRDDFDRFLELFTSLKKTGQAVSYGVLSPTGQLMASAIFFFFRNRSCYILVGNHPNGKTLGASHALIDTFIRDYAGQPMILDFEGSDFSGLAFFYSSFGATEERYAAIRVNKLPRILKWLKKD